GSVTGNSRSLPNSPTSRGNRNRECEVPAGIEEEVCIGCTSRARQEASSPAQEGRRAGEGPEGSESEGSEGRGPLPGGRSCARVFSRWRGREVGRPADRVPRRGALRSDPTGGHR